MLGGYTQNDGVREIDITIYDDYPVYLMEDARDLQNYQTTDDYSASRTSSSKPSNKFNSNEFFRNDVFVTPPIS